MSVLQTPVTGPCPCLCLCAQDDGDTPLRLATREHHTAIKRALLAAGAVKGDSVSSCCLGVACSLRTLLLVWWLWQGFHNLKCTTVTVWYSMELALVLDSYYVWVFPPHVVVLSLLCCVL